MYTPDKNVQEDSLFSSQFSDELLYITIQFGLYLYYETTYS